MSFKLLIVDDHPETRNIIARVLEEQSYRIITAESGVQALPLADKERPHLIMLDMMMPEMDGIETCRRMRANPHLAKVPIIMFTAVDEVQQKIAGFEAGVDDYLIKPTEPVELIDRVNAMLESVYGESIPPTDDPEPGSVSPSISAVSRPSGQRRTIAIIGARGGVGTTTVAMNLAVSLAENRVPTVLADLDMIQGHIALYLNQKVSNSIHGLAHLSGDEFARQISHYLVNYGPSLKLLLATPNLSGQQTILSAAQVAILSQVLAKVSECVIIDCGCGVSAVTRPILENADQVIICLRPERVALLAAKQLIVYLREVLFPHTILSVVMLEAMNGINLPRGSVESYLGHQLWALMPVHVQEMAQAVNKGLPLVKAFPQAKASLLFQQLAQQLVEA